MGEKSCFKNKFVSISSNEGKVGTKDTECANSTLDIFHKYIAKVLNQNTNLGPLLLNEDPPQLPGGP